MRIDKKAKIREYKDIPRPMGVFQIKNKVNGKVLIGSSNNLSKQKFSGCISPESTIFIVMPLRIFFLQ